MKENSCSVDDLFAVIVIYKAKLVQSETFVSLNASLKRMNAMMDVLVYDNSPEPQFNESQFQLENLKITYVHDPSNSGVSRAYNTGAKVAGTMNKKWFIFLDDDTEFHEDGVEKYIGSVNRNPGYDLFAPIMRMGDLLLSPSKYAWKRGFAPKEMSPGIASLLKFHPINSGVMISADLFKRSGGYNEKIRLDFSDFYFMDKLSKHIQSFVVMDIVMEHSLSGIENRNDTAKLLNGYVNYCIGGKISSESVSDYVQLFTVVFLRGLLLTYLCRDTKFLSVFLKNFVLYKK